MKKLLISLAVFTGSQLFAQQSKVVSAFSALGYYQKDNSDIESLQKAQGFIDQAILNDGTVTKPKTWYYRGNIYMAMYQSKNPDLAAHKDENLVQAAESYEKVFTLDPSYEFAGESYKQALVAYQNMGIEAFNKKDYAKSLSFFEKVISLTEKKGAVSSDAIQNAAVASMNSNNYDKAITYYNQLIASNADTSGIFYGQLYKAQIAKGDSASALTSLEKGRVKFPDNQALLTENLNFLFKKKRNAEAESLLKLAIEKDPTNHTLYLAAGSTYESLGKMDEAVAAYKKAIEVNPSAWQAYYNLGAYYNNEGKKLQEAANNEKDDKKYKSGIKLADEKLNLSLTYLEKAKELMPANSPDRMDVLKALKQLYVRLSMTEKFEAIKKEME